MASSQPATSVNVVLGMSLEISLALDLANCMTPRPPPCMLLSRNKKISTIRPTGSRKEKMNELSALGLATSVVTFSIVPASYCAMAAL